MKLRDVLRDRRFWLGITASCATGLAALPLPAIPIKPRFARN